MLARTTELRAINVHKVPQILYINVHKVPQISNLDE
jgi:hypothetical protein